MLLLAHLSFTERTLVEEPWNSQPTTYTELQVLEHEEKFVFIDLPTAVLGSCHSAPWSPERNHGGVQESVVFH